MRVAWGITISNFVIPCTLQAIQVVVVLIGRSKEQSELQWFYECSFLMIINGYVTILGVIFATVWAEATNWAIQEGASWARIPTTPMSAEMSAETPSSATFLYRLKDIDLPEAGSLRP
jgi:hypothetical protein